MPYFNSKILYIVSTRDELDSTTSDAIYLVKYLSRKYRVKHIIIKESLKLKNSVILFTDKHHYLSVFEVIDPSNIVIATWWHGWKGTMINVNKSVLRRCLARLRIKTEVAESWFTTSKTYQILLLKLAKSMGNLYKLICSCDEVIERIVKEHNIPREKIIKIPLGVDLEIFQPASDEAEREQIKERLGLPKDKFIIGNFSRDTQMDGTPKWVKDPETFIKVIKNVYQEEKGIFVLLTNQRRGFVKHYLEKLDIPFKHIKEKEHRKLSDIYKITDLSLITSREEGGPNQLYESMASETVVVSTRQGMALEWLWDGSNGFLCDIEDVNCLTQKTLQLLRSPSLRNEFNRKNLEIVKKLDWKVIADQHDELIFSKIL